MKLVKKTVDKWCNYLIMNEIPLNTTADLKYKYMYQPIMKHTYDIGSMQYIHLYSL